MEFLHLKSVPICFPPIFSSRQHSSPIQLPININMYETHISEQKKSKNIFYPPTFSIFSDSYCNQTFFLSLIYSLLFFEIGQEVVSVSISFSPLILVLIHWAGPHISRQNSYSFTQFLVVLGNGNFKWDFRSSSPFFGQIMRSACTLWRKLGYPAKTNALSQVNFSHAHWWDLNLGSGSIGPGVHLVP